LDYYDGAVCKKIAFTDHLSGIEVTAPGADPNRIIMHFHGGAHCFGSVWGAREFVGRMSTATKARVISVDYRLAPENPFPAGLEDARTAWHWVLKQYPHASVAVAGESAGGNLAFALLVKLSQLGEIQPVACITMSPWLLLTTPATRQRDSIAQGRLRKVWDDGAAKMVLPRLRPHRSFGVPSTRNRRRDRALSTCANSCRSEGTSSGRCALNGQSL